MTHPRDGCVAFEQKKFVKQSQGCNKSCARFLFGHQHSHRALANCWLPQTTRSYAAEGDELGSPLKMLRCIRQPKFPDRSSQRPQFLAIRNQLRNAGQNHAQAADYFSCGLRPRNG
jgi:hypothetical protein